MSLAKELGRTIKYPTSIVVRGADIVGVELAKSLLEQGGYVIMVDFLNDYTRDLISVLDEYDLFTFVEFGEIHNFDEYLRRLDYVFYLNHSVNNLESKISTQEFLEYSKFLDQVLTLNNKFESKFLISTAIKAHQFLFIKNELDTNFDTNSELHTVYTEAEIQRYAESLTLEYIQKSAVDARIVRIGELIGDGVEYDQNSDVTRLIQESLSSENITLIGDGLSSSYYVHLQDAVYGIIKAQFSKNTRGETYSIAYEYEVSNLSIAYKLNEFGDEQKEITFTSEEDSLGKHPIRLYKPAPNLMRVGWKPRVRFERALKQTYDYLKKYFKTHPEDPEDDINLPNGDTELVEKKTDVTETNGAQEEVKKRKGIKGWFKWIFFAEAAKTVSNKDDTKPKEAGSDSGALGRLIAERKAQENGRKGSVLIANKRLMEKYKSKQKQPLSDRVSSRMNQRLDSFTGRFSSLRYMTMKQLVLIIILIIVLVFVYFNVFAVLLSSGKNATYSYIYIDEFSENVDDREYSAALKSSNAIVEQLEEIDYKLERYELIEGISITDETLSLINQINQNTKLADEGLDVGYSSGEGLISYMKNFNPEIIYRKSSNSVISSQIEEDYSAYMVKMNPDTELIADGVKKIDEAVGNLRNLNIPFPHKELETQFNKLVGSYDKLVIDFNMYDGLNGYVPHLIGRNSEQNYVFVLVDDTSYLPAGGEPMSMLYVSMKNGNISELGIESDIINEYGTISIQDAFILEQISLTKNQLIDSENATLSDLFYLQQGDLYLDEIARIVSEKNGKRIDGVMIVNIDILADSLAVAGKIQYENLTFDEENLIANISLLLQSSENPDSLKNEVVTNIFALSFKSIMNNIWVKLPESVDLIEVSSANKNFISKFYNLPIKNKVEASDNMAQLTPDYISINAISNSNPSSIPLQTVDVSVDVLFKDDYTTRKTVSISPNGLENLSYFSVCLPSGVSNITFPENFKFTQVQSFGEYQTCVRLEPTDDPNGILSFSFNTISFQNILNNDYDFIFGLRKQPGLKTNMSVSFVTENLKIEELSDDTPVEDNKFSISEELITDKIVGVKFVD